MRVPRITFVLLALLAGCGKPVSLPQPGAPVRIVSLAPSLTEMIYALSAEESLVGRSRVCAFPTSVTNVPVAGDFGAPMLETLAQLAPHWVVAVDSEDRNTGRSIERLGIQHREIPCRTLDDIPKALRALGEILNRQAAAEKLAGKLETELVELRRAPKPVNPPKVFIEVWGDPLMTAGKHAFISELVELAGGVNVMADIDRDFFQVTPEAVLARNPDIVLLLEMETAAQSNAAIARRPGWAHINAVKNGRVYSGLSKSILEVPGPRVLEGVELLRRCLQ